MSRRPVIGVMGPGDEAPPRAVALADELGRLIAAAGWVTLSGGRAAGVMDAVSRGARRAGGLVIGVLPTADGTKTSEFVDVAIVTDMGSARNNVNVLSSDVVVVCGMGCGTASEAALALKAGKPVILLAATPAAEAFFREIGRELVFIEGSPEEAVARCRTLLPHPAGSFS